MIHESKLSWTGEMAFETELDGHKLIKAIELSQEKYCGVSALYKKAINVTYEIKMF